MGSREDDGADQGYVNRVKFEKKLHERFINQINRLLYNHGTGGLQERTLDRDGLFVRHTPSTFSAALKNVLLFHYTPRSGVTYWAADQKIRYAMRRIDEIFVLDELADI